jgi:hypothetical protein
MRLKSARLTDLSGEEEKASNISIICYSRKNVNNATKRDKMRGQPLPPSISRQEAQQPIECH